MAAKAARKEHSMTATLIVKEVPSKDKVVVYTTMPEGVVAPNLYRPVEESAVRSLLTGKYEYAQSYLEGGMLRVPKKLRDDVRAIPTHKGGSDKPGSEVNSMQTRKNTPKKGSAEAKARMAKVRAARKSNKTENNTTLTLDASEPTSKHDLSTLAGARQHAIETGDWSHVERILG